MSAQGERLLVLAVDRDGDLESKTKVRSPVFGREGVVSAATQLAISDPEEADANSIFAAVKEYDRLQSMSGELRGRGRLRGQPTAASTPTGRSGREVENILGKGQFPASSWSATGPRTSRCSRYSSR